MPNEHAGRGVVGQCDCATTGEPLRSDPVISEAKSFDERTAPNVLLVDEDGLS